MKEKKRFRDTELWKVLRTLLELAALGAVIAGIVLLFMAAGISEGMAEEWDGHEEEYEIAYAICVKDDHVNVRPFPSTKHERSSELDPGELIYLDGQKRNGFYHVVGLNNESGDGWVHKGYIVFDEPVLEDRDATVICRGRLHARKNVNGEHRRWIHGGETIHVYYRSDEWCSTDHGYVRTEYLELEGE